jgi:integrase
MERPTPTTRDSIPDRAGIRTILKASRREFKSQRPESKLTGHEFQDFLAVLNETGMRPSEAMALEGRMIDWDRSLVVMESKTTRRTGRKREIQLTGRAMEILRRAAALNPEGPVLRNARGRPWTRHATACRFARLREKLGMGGEATSEALRHAWITDGLEAGVPIATVSALAGHVDTTMVSRVYSKLHDRQEHLKEALAKVRPGQGASASGPDASGADPTTDA